MKLIILACFGSVVGLTLAAVFFDWLAEREEQRVEAERQRLDRIMAASTPRAAGLRGESRRVS